MKKIYSAQVIFILLFALSSCLILNAQSPSTNGSSTNWNLASAWTPTGIPDLTFWQGTQDVVVQHDMNSSGSLNVTSGNSIRVTNGATLTISGNLTFAGTGRISEIIVDAGSTLIVTGNFAGGFAHVVTISGTLNVGGNYTIASGSYTQTISGDVTVGGNLENTANGVVNVSGSIEITGQLKLSSSGKVSGTSGYITYGSYDILCNGFAYLQCGGTNYGENASCTTPPANGLDFSSCGPYVPTPTPTANFTPSATTVTTSQTISFTNSSSDATSYSWNFGDGSSTSSATSPSHQYSLAGSYTVTLTATNSAGSDTATQAITVNSSDDCDTPTVLSNDNFNTDFGTWIDGGNRVTRQSESYITSRNGTQPGGGLINYTCNGYLSTPFVALVGAGASGITTNKTLTSSSYDLSNYAAVTIEYDHFVTSMDNNNEGYNLQYSSNGGSSWATIKNFRLGNDDFENNDCGENDARQKKIVVISSDDFTFSSQNKFRFFVDTDSGGTGGGDFFLIDNIVVKGYNLDSPGITMEQWNGISGTAVSNLTSNSNYPNNPSTTSILDSFEIPTNVRDNYGVKVSGYIKAPTTGSYVFWIASDDNGELNLSTDEDPANKTTIATVGAWTNSRQWNRYGSQKSAPVSLTEGQIYYIEAFMKEQGGGDNLAVGWAKPGESTNAPSEVIPGDVLFSSPPQLASFTTDNNTIEVNNTVNFTNTSTGFDTYVWDFGDGSTTSTETNPSHQYTETGTYTVTLTATSSCGSDTATTTIAVNNPTETLFFENFEDESQGDTSGTDAYNTDWDTQTSTNADRFEVRNGKYFEAIKTRNTAYWKTQTIDISNYDDLKLSSYIRFDGSLDPSDYIKFQYKLDGGSLTNIPNAQYYGTNSDTTYNWNLTGVTGSTLEIWVAFKTSGGDEKHRIDNITLTAVSNCSPITAYTVTGDDLAYCSGNTQTTTIGLSDSDVGVDYQLLKDGVNEGAPIAGTGSALSYGAFSDNGTYTIEATNSEGCTQTMTGNVVITVTNVTSAFSITPTSVVLGNSVQFNNLSSNATSYAWDFGDSFGISLLSSPSYTYNATGTYTVTLVATGANGCNATSTQNITVTPAPEELFYEDFSTEANSATSGTDLYGTTWGSDDSSGNPRDFEVYDDSDFIDAVFWAEDTDGLVYWYTDNINIQGYTNLNLRSFIEFYKIDNDGDYIKFYYKLNGGNLQEIATFTGDYSDTYYDWDLTGVTGDNLQIWVEFNSDDNDDYHGIGNVKLTGTTNYNIWRGSESDLATNTSRWSKGSLPTSSSDVLIPNTKHLRLTSDTQVNSIIVKAGAEFSIGKDGSLTTVDFTNEGTTSLFSDDDEFSSLIVTGTATGNASYNRWTNNWELDTNGNDIIASPVKNQSWTDVIANNVVNGTNAIYNNGTLYAFYAYNNGYYGWGNPYSVNDTSTMIESGKGYRVSTPAVSSQTVKFTGQVETGNVSVNLRNVQTRWNVVGNPYPSYIDMYDFIVANEDKLDSGYIGVLGYTGINDEDGWVYYNKTTAQTQSITVAPGQGFYLAAKSDNVTVTFTPDMRTIVGGDDFLQDGRSTSDVSFHKLRLSLENGSQIRHTELYFLENNNVSEGFDSGYDTNIFDSGDNYNLYSKLVTDSTDEKLAIQTLPLDNVSQSIVPIGVEAVTGQQITFSIDDIVIPDDVVIYLEDRDKDTWTLLNDMTSYIVDVNETISGTGRFFLHFEPNDALSNKGINLNEISIKAIHNTKQIIISGQLAEDTNVTIYDINGKTILKTTIDAYNTTNRIDVKNLITGIYLVQLNNNSQTVSKQILVK